MEMKNDIYKIAKYIYGISKRTFYWPLVGRSLHKLTGNTIVSFIFVENF